MRPVMLGACLFLGAWLGFHVWSLPDPRALVTTHPPQSALMRARVAEASESGRSYRLHHRFVPLQNISKSLQQAVLLAEDQRFWQHQGIDWVETRNAMHEAIEARELRRGGSTLTQQLAKNLYLSGERSLVRKAKEWWIARELEKTLSKKRILELYLNYAEWGEGIFGIEMAARLHFQKSAARLDAAEASILAAMLPSPLTRSPQKPSKALSSRARHIGAMMVRQGHATQGMLDARFAVLLR